MANINNKGFTLIELLVAVALMCIIFLFFSIGCSTAKMRQAFLDEVKQNLEIIRTAVEKYAVDHDGNYPPILLGGDLKGWDTEEGNETIITRPRFAENLRQTNLKGGGARPPKDPLIDGGYLESYPENPLIAHMLDRAPSLSGGRDFEMGSGDVRFGFNSTIMGNVLDDPRYLWSVYPVFDQPEKNRLQPTRLVNTMSQTAYMRNFSPLHPLNEINPFYSSAGVPDSADNGKTIHRWWPGEFFYRSSGDLIMREMSEENFDNAEHLTIWDFEISTRNRYILGAFGDNRTPGLDLIRATTVTNEIIQNLSGVTPETYRRSPAAPYPEDKSVYLSPPEVFGGGGKGIPPVFPYLDESCNFIYGAPDGHPDGILQPVFIDGNRTLDEL